MRRIPRLTHTSTTAPTFPKTKFENLPPTCLFIESVGLGVFVLQDCANRSWEVLFRLKKDVTEKQIADFIAGSRAVVGTPGKGPL
jgi:hypothetical protein